MVIEIPNVGALVKERATVLSILQGIATEQQLKDVEAQLVRMLGFDPTTKEGLAEAGLPESGPAAAEFTDLGKGALWIVPVGDPAKLKTTLDQLVKSRAKIDATSEEKTEGGTITVHSRAWGEEKITFAAYTFAKGYAFIGLGRRGIDLVKAALVRKPEESATAHPEYTALTKQIGDRAIARALVPSADAMAAKMTEIAGKGPPSELAKALKSLGWSAQLEERAITVDGRFRFTEQGLERIRSVLKVADGAPKGVVEVQHAEAALVAQASGDLAALLTIVAPPGSPEAQDLDAAFADLKSQLGVDVRAQVVPQLTGHAAVAFGLGDLSAIEGGFHQILADPTSVLWSSIAVGVKSPDEIKKLGFFDQRIDPFLAARQLQRTNRTVGDKEVVVVRQGNQAIMDSFLDEGAWVFSNAPGETDRLIKNEVKAASDPLGGKGGVFVELRVPPVAKAARSLDIAKIAGGGAEAMFVRGMVDKALQILDRIDRFELRLEPAADGAFARARLTFVKPAK
jgi:hypothetical protein